MGFVALPPNQVLDAARVAHHAMQRVAVHVELDALLGGHRQRASYDIATDGRRLLYRVSEPRTSTAERSDRTFYFSNNRLIAFDAVANERLDRQIGTGSLLSHVTDTLGAPDDMIRDLLAPVEMDGFLNQMRKLSGWQVSSKRGLDELVRVKAASRSFNRTSLSFDHRTHLLRDLGVRQSQGYIHWTFAYSPVRLTSYHAPTTARRVSSFTVAPMPPQYASATAERVVNQMVAAYQRLTSGTIAVESDDSVGTICFTGSSLFEDHPRFTYAYDGRILSIVNRVTKRFYRGRAGRSTVTDIVGDLGGTLDPISRQLLLRRVPFKEIFAPNVRVSVAGQIQSSGVDCEILKLEIPRARVSMFVRTDNHFVDSLSTDILDGRGHVMTSSQKRFRYRDLGQPIRTELFTLSVPSGERVEPLPKLKLFGK